MYKYAMVLLLVFIGYGLARPPVAFAETTDVAPQASSDSHFIKPPFSWPDAYSITYSQTGYGSPVINTFTKDGLKARNDVRKADHSESIYIFRLDEHRMTSISQGVTQETILPPNYPEGGPFPTVGTWELVGADQLNGLPTLKYRVSNDPARHDPTKPMSYFFLWLTPDNNTPLKMEENGMVREFSQYTVGHQDPKIFEPPQH